MTDDGSWTLVVWRDGCDHPDLSDEYGEGFVVRSCGRFDTALFGKKPLDYSVDVTANVASFEVVDGVFGPSTFYSRARVSVPCKKEGPATVVCDRDALGCVNLLCCKASAWIVITTSAVPRTLLSEPWMESFECLDVSPRVITTFTLASSEPVVTMTVTEPLPDKSILYWLGGGRSSELIQPPASDSPLATHKGLAALGLVERLLTVLDGVVRKELAQEAVSRRIAECHSVRVLFSGGLDSTVVTAILARCLPPDVMIHLINIAFELPSSSSKKNSYEDVPDRQSGRESFADLQKQFPERTWQFHAVNVTKAEADAAIQHIVDLLKPSDTNMDVSIGMAMWFAARHDVLPVEKDSARIASPPPLFLGQGSDEQFGGYMRFRHDFKTGGWKGLNDALVADMERLWQRNLGRDGRVLGDCGNTVQCTCYPFLEHDFCAFLSSIPLWLVADLTQPAGTGDKFLLRALAEQLGLATCTNLAKRAIQFGSRIAKLMTSDKQCTKREARSCGADKFSV